MFPYIVVSAGVVFVWMLLDRTPKPLRADLSRPGGTSGGEWEVSDGIEFSSSEGGAECGGGGDGGGDYFSCGGEGW